MSLGKSIGKHIIEFINFVVAFILLIAFYPYEFYSAFMIDTTSLMALIFKVSIVLLSILTLLFRRCRPAIPIYLYLVVFMQFMGLVLTSLSKGQAIPVGQMLLKITALLMVVYLSSTCGLVKFYKLYNRWLLLMSFLAALSMVLMWIGNLYPIYPFIDLADDSTMYNYGITFAQYTDVNVYRPAGFFDEPGALASWGIFAIIFDKAYVNDGKTRLLLMVSLFATLSFGYFMQLAVFLLLFSIFGMTSKNRIKNIILIVIAMGFVITTIYNLKGTEYDGIYQKTVGRFEYLMKESKSQGTMISVDNRKEYSDAALKEFKANPLWGTKNKNVEVGNNIYEPLALYGIIGTFFLYFPFIFIFVKACIDKDVVIIKCMIVIMLGFLHRPFHNNLLSHFIIYSFIAMYYQHRIQPNRMKLYKQ